MPDELERLAHELGALARRRWPEQVSVKLTVGVGERQYARRILLDDSDTLNEYMLNRLLHAFANKLMHGDLDRGENDADGR